MKFFLSFVCLLIFNGNPAFGKSQENPIPDTVSTLAIGSAGVDSVQEDKGQIEAANIIIPRD